MLLDSSRPSSTRKERLWVCFRLILVGLFGGILGSAVVLLIGITDAPQLNPADFSEHEWYTPFVLIWMVIGGFPGGAIAGVIALQAWSVARGRALFFGAVGVLLGLAIGWLFLPHEGNGGALIFHAFLTWGLCLAGLGFAVLRKDTKSINLAEALGQNGSV